jgi:tetratricopeptide (TPR) repeat protein
MRHCRFFICVGVSAAALAAPAAAQIPQTFKNLQVLPKDIPRPQLIATMRGFAGELGVRCTHCHVGPDDLQGMDFATDEKQTKQVARTMIRMMRSINTDFVSTLPASDAARQQVTCLTCHRREAKPPRPLHEVLLATIGTGGVPAAVEQYKKLRAETMESGLYDFREPALGIVALTLREQKRFDEALEILKLNAAIFPKSAMVQIVLGDTAAQKGDLALAEASYLRALELDPGNAFAAKSLEMIKAKRRIPNP